MQVAIQNYNRFQRQAQSQHQIVKVDDLKDQIVYLQELVPRQSVYPSDRKVIQKYIRIYQVAIRQIQRMKKQFTTPDKFNQRIAQIFDNKIEQIALQKTSEIRSSQIEIPTFKKNIVRQNVIQLAQQKNDLASPGLKSFFQKKQAQIKLNRSKSNFRSVLQTEQNKESSRSISKQQSRSSGSSFMRRPGQQAQLRRVLEQNKKIKQEYEKKLKRELELSEFEKKLLKDEKDRYMQKIEQLQSELEKLYRANYKLKEQVQIKEKTLKQKSQFGNSDSFRNVDENINTPLAHGKDYYQPYVMQTKHNDLKRLNMKCQTQYDPSQGNRIGDISRISHKNNPIMGNNINQTPEDFLGRQLQKQLQQIDKQYSRSHQSSKSGKKWGHQQRGNQFNQFVNQDDDDLLSVLKKTDSQEELYQKKNKNGKNSKKSSNNNGYYNKMPSQSTNNNAFQKKAQNSFWRQQSSKPFPQIPPINILPPTMNRKSSQQHSFKSTNFLQQHAFQQPYQPQTNYSFTRAVNKDYSMTSNPTNYDTFDMTKTYLNISQNQQSETNKYIDSRTSTRNKVAFFKDSLILIKNDTFELAFKRSALVNTKDRVRVIFFIKNKTNQILKIHFRYEYDASYFKLKVNQRIQSIPPNSQGREDLQIYGFSTVDLNEVIDVMVDVDFNKYGLWMPVLWIQFQQNDRFKLPDKNQEISFIPDRQFKNFQSARSFMPLMWGGKDSQSQWAYLYGITKFGPCFVKLTWEVNELKIQTDAKWIDLLAFVMHHVK